MVKKYLVGGLMILLGDFLFLSLFLLGVFPLKLSYFLVLVLALFFLALKFNYWFFLFFISVFPLETIVVSPDVFPVGLRPFQLLGLILFLSAVVLHLGKKLGFVPLSFKKICIGCRIFRKKDCQTVSSEQALNSFDRLVIVFGAVSFFGLIFAPDRWLSLKQNLVLVSFVFLYLLVRNYSQSLLNKIETAWSFLLGSIPVLLFGFHQAWAKMLGKKSFEVMDGRINSTFSEPDWLGVYLCFILAVILVLKIFVPDSRPGLMVGKSTFEKFSRYALNLFAVLVVGEIFLTVSRSAWLGAFGVIFAYGLVVFWKFNRSVAWKELFSFGLVLVLSILLFSFSGLSAFHFANRATSSFNGKQKITISCLKNSSVPTEISSIKVLADYNCKHIDLEEIEKERAMGFEVKEVYRPDPNVEIRKNIYQKTFVAIFKHPLVGQGLGSSALLLGYDERGSGLNASNIFLEIWFSFGIFGLIIFGLIIFLPFFRAFKWFFVLHCFDGELGVWAVFIGLSTVALIVPNFFNSGLFLGFFWLYLAFLGSFMEESFKKRTS